MILETMLQRLFASLVHGPSMNARPHRSRQRCDWMDFSLLQGLEPASALKTLLEKRKIEFPAKVQVFTAPSFPEAEWSNDQKQARDAYQKQTKLLKKLRDIADDALEYMNDHGESCLALGFPLISMPPAADEKSLRGSSSRVLAPLLLMPIQLQVRTGSRAGVTLECVGEGADLLVANPALLAWLERQTGKSFGEIYLDEEASDPWREVEEILGQINALLDLVPPPAFHHETVLEFVPVADKLPKSVSVLPSAVLGLFPLSNQSLLRDTRWMLENQPTLQEPVSAFLNPQALHDEDPETESADESVTVQGRDFAQEWLVSAADPCQANAVLASREAKALVVHGPPGTGKSQTITNMIADHLARGERVLFVCDKRTALDVVKYRLDATGLGDLCGVVHDPSADRKDFYMGLREQLENLADTPVPQDPRAQLQSVNDQLAALHLELESYRQKIHANSNPAERSFHDLLGQWLSHAAKADAPVFDKIPGLRLAEVEAAATTVDEMVRRAEKAGYPTNPFRDLLGIGLADFLTRSTRDTHAVFETLDAAAKQADADRPNVILIPLDTAKPLVNQAAVRESAVALLQEIAVSADLTLAGIIARVAAPKRQEWKRELPEVQAWLQQSETPLDRAMLSGARSAGVLTLAAANQHLAALQAWEPIAGSFFKKLFAGSTKKAATAALLPLGLSLDAGWQQGLAFYRGVKSRLLVQDWLGRVTGAELAWLDDGEMQTRVKLIQNTWELLDLFQTLGAAEVLQAHLDDPTAVSRLADGLTQEVRWAQALHHLSQLVRQSGLFTAGVENGFIERWLGGEPAQQITQAWLVHLTSLEDMVRLQHALGQLPPLMREPAKQMLREAVPAEDIQAAFMHQAVENLLRDRLHHDPALAAIDGERIEAAFDAFLRLSQDKVVHVRNYIRFLWVTHQRGRLLASTGSQLNKLGAGLRQRLYVRGKKALKLRQMLATGAEVEGGDPLFDLCPVWMASPSTVAQIFPRNAIFDVVIFDEASQCRLEEALPVLLRGHRVVIAGDQKQLPPTRFFESALADSGDSDAETAEELFYQQQQEAEDLLTAALNLDVREAYLDVHYRSRNEALIGFSNEQYYGSRLQPIPGHPRNKALSTPIRLHRVNGVYAERANVQEAEAAVNLIAELLAEPNPPSIGVACFNLTQKEAIHEALAKRVESDAEFARKYEAAKTRKGRDSFEGLFVKNLENVQGDERDVMIISTTFGPDTQGKFRRNFGALSQREGGRRLNVLVTRARDAVHVLTSIPSAEYSAVEAVPPGQIPNGRLQLYAYLRYAERLAEVFASYQEDLEKMRRDAKPELKAWETATPSRLATALGQAMLDRHETGTHIHWGNEGFCVDVACIHPLMPADVTVGVLTDFSRFHKTPDPIEWDIFRTRVLRTQGWEIQRLWSPVLFRRFEEMLQQVKAGHDRLSAPPSDKQIASMVE